MTSHIPAEAFPPGDFILEEIEARGWSPGDLGRTLGLSGDVIAGILSGANAVTPEVAAGLGAVFGTGPELWENLERTYRLSLARAEKSRAV